MATSGVTAWRPRDAGVDGAGVLGAAGGVRAVGAVVLRELLAALRVGAAAFFCGDFVFCDTFFAGALRVARWLAFGVAGAAFFAAGCFFAIAAGAFAATRLRLVVLVAVAFFAGARAVAASAFADAAFVPCPAGVVDFLLGAAAVFRTAACFDPAFFMTNLIG